MPSNRSVVFGSTGVILVAALLRLWPADCPLQANEARQVSFADPKWGTVTNFTVTHGKTGDLLEDTPVNGFHRVVKTVTVPAAGLYRISVETAFAGTSDFVMEAGGPSQPKYALIGGDAKTGRIIEKHGDIVAAGVDVLADEPRHYRWWLEIRLVPGEVSYDFGLAAGNSRVFRGNGQCRIALDNPSFREVTK
jgi:hypothetical protein